jgi:hypothetical protein
MRLQRQFRKFLVVFIVAAAMLATLGAPAAQAGEAARNCDRYYAQGNPDSSWYFTVCVKLVHDPNTHDWWATASLSSPTPGIRLYLDEEWMRVTGIGTYYMNTSTRRGQGTDFVTAITYKSRCGGGHYFTGYARGHARWPNGVTSGDGWAITEPSSYWGTC